MDYFYKEVFRCFKNIALKLKLSVFFGRPQFLQYNFAQKQKNVANKCFKYECD